MKADRDSTEVPGRGCVGEGQSVLSVKKWACFWRKGKGRGTAEGIERATARSSPPPRRVRTRVESRCATTRCGATRGARNRAFVRVLSSAVEQHKRRAGAGAACLPRPSRPLEVAQMKARKGCTASSPREISLSRSPCHGRVRCRECGEGAPASPSMATSSRRNWRRASMAGSSAGRWVGRGGVRRGEGPASLWVC